MRAGMAAQALLAGLLAAAALARASVPTPTPVPRLTGGFGRPTAARSSESGGKSARSVVAIKSESLPGGPEIGKAAASRPTRPAPTVLAFPHPSLTGGTEGEWRQTAAQARQSMAVARARAAALEEAQMQLAYRYQYGPDSNSNERVTLPALERNGVELVEARREPDAAEKELADLPEKARRAGAYPGWIRQ